MISWPKRASQTPAPVPWPPPLPAPDPDIQDVVAELEHELIRTRTALARAQSRYARHLSTHTCTRSSG